MVSRTIRVAEVLLPLGWCSILFWLVSTNSCNYPEPSHHFIKGRVTNAYAHGTDFVIQVANDSGHASYYLNRYLGGGKSLDSLKKLVLNKEVMMKYYLHYSALNPKGRSRPIDTLYLGHIMMY